MHSAHQTFTTTIFPHTTATSCLHLLVTFNMNTFGSYLLPPSTCDSANNADKMQSLFPRPQTPLPTELSCTDLTSFHSESVPPSVPTGTSANSLNPMLMFYTSDSVTQLWNHFLQDNTKGRNGNFHVADCHVVCTISPYFMPHPTKLSAWFITWPGTAGKDNPSGMSRLITGTPLHLEDLSVCAHTHTLEFHVYHCILGLPFLRQGGYTFYYTNHHVLTCETIPHAEDPVTTIVAIPDYHTTEVGQYLSIQANTFNQVMVPGYPNLAKPPRHIWEYREEEEQKEQEVKFDWFSSSEDNIREEVARILKERESRSG
jgi:hypothetical protein